MRIGISAPGDMLGDMLGDIIHDLASRRGVVNGTTIGVAGVMVVKGLVPLSELVDHQMRLRALTSGRGRYSIELSHFEAVPPAVQAQWVGAFRVREEE